MSKSYVSTEQHQCVVCGATYDTGAILMDKRLRESMGRYTITGTGMCPKHQKLKDDGYVALVEADEKTQRRLGRVLHVKEEAWDKIFNVPVPDHKIAYIDSDAVNKLAAIAEDTEE